MKYIQNIQSLFVAALVAFAASSAVAANDIVGEVVAVLDGDTITVLDGQRQQHRIRFAGIDAPEKSQAYGQVAKRALSDLIYRHQVTVRPIDPAAGSDREVPSLTRADRYGRTIGRVFDGGRDINRAMVAGGYAWVYRQYAGGLGADRASYEAAETEARAARNGLWADSAPVPPWEYRHGGERHAAAKGY